jgi:FkbM family methyltransferase
MIKTLIKKILKIFGWRLIKVVKPPKALSPENNEKIIECYKLSNGIIHIGAHRGTEAPIYAWFNKSVIWIEANKEIYDELLINLHSYENQKAYNYLLLEKSHKNVNFNISNNDGASSSIYDFGESHQNSKLFNNRNFKFTKKVKVNSYAFDEFINKEKIIIRNHNLWIIDVQGAELPVLLGSEKNLNYCKYLIIEVSKNEFYKGGTKWEDLKKFLNEKNFELICEPKNDHDDAIFKNLTFKST